MELETSGGRLPFLPVREDVRALINDAAAALQGARLTVVETAVGLPAKPGLYAAYATDEACIELGLPDLEAPGRPVYVGKAEDSLRGRDSQSHFRVGQTGQSTLRRSIAALLRDSYGLRGRPRNPAKPDYFPNFGLSEEHDAILQAWMEANVTVSVWETPVTAADPAGKLLEHVERGVIALWAPPLNDAHNPRKWRALRGIRSVMANDARLFAATDRE